MVRRISSSRPMTGSSLPSRAGLGQVAGVLLQRVVGALAEGLRKRSVRAAVWKGARVAETQKPADLKPLDVPQLIVVLTGMFALLSTLSMTFPLLSLLSEAGGVEERVIGLMGAMPSVGLIVASFCVPVLNRRLGTFRYLVLCAVAGAAIYALLGVFKTPLAWFPLLFLMGFAVDGIFVICEGWINSLANDANRGRVIGVYGTVASLGLTMGPTILTITGTQSDAPFVIGALLMLAFAGPVIVLRRKIPRFDGDSHGGVLGFVRKAPTLVLAVLMFGLFETVVASLFPVYASRAGLVDTQVTTAIAVMFWGYLAFQFPIGWIAERTSARGMMLLCATVGVGGGLLLPAAMADPWFLWAVMFIWGGLGAGVYTLALIELGQRFSGAAMLAGNATFAVAWGVGGIIGPASTGGLMDAFGTGVFGPVLAGAFGVLLAVGVVRSLRRTARS
jgi:MFS family permease